ncbi:MAG TPA: YbhB/YbcL family Raf kinase inhibitor-like protein [Stellaceae bacterium]|nr:YbhB/YbcL family Raf kinase inhibitor-like protein [Stellaceae bacterium]
MPFAISSPAFADGQPIPALYSCVGANISPPIMWRDAPSGTRSFVLVVEDPDAPGRVFRHWGVYDIPADRTALSQGASLEGLARAINDFGHARYDGPCPPPGTGVHHYRFRLAALDRAALVVGADADVAALWRAAQPYVIAEAELVGTYSR